MPRAKDLPIWISTTRMASRLDVHPKTLKRYYREGKIPEAMVRRLPGGEWRWDWAKVEEILGPVSGTKVSA